MDRPVKLDYLAVAAHPDDMEITCGGLLIKAIDQGYAAGGLDLTVGEMGTRGSTEQRRAEAADCATRGRGGWLPRGPVGGSAEGAGAPEFAGPGASSCRHALVSRRACAQEGGLHSSPGTPWHTHRVPA